MTVRLPIPGSDVDNWGDILNGFLGVAHNGDGTLKIGRGYGTQAFGFPGAAEPQVGVVGFIFPWPVTLLGSVARANTAPTGRDLICDVNLNDSTIYSTTGNRPTIAAGTKKVTTMPAPDVTAAAQFDVLTCDLDQEGLTIPGSDIVVVVAWVASS